MLTLFYKPTCPYCQRVLQTIEDLGVEIDLKDISSDSKYIDELVELGGRKQVPYLIDGDQDVQMYESGDIIMHLEKFYSSTDQITG